MKDKLVKTGHKKAYYKARAFGFVLLSILGFSIVSSVPVLIAVQTAEIRKAEEESQTSEIISSSSDESSVETSSFFD